MDPKITGELAINSSIRSLKATHQKKVSPGSEIDAERTLSREGLLGIGRQYRTAAGFVRFTIPARSAAADSSRRGAKSRPRHVDFFLHGIELRVPRFDAVRCSSTFVPDAHC
jgi:hypothetical protein